MGDEYGEPDDEVTVLADGDSPPHDLKRRELLNSGWEYEGVWDEGLSVFIVRVESFVDLRVHLDNMPPSRHRVNVVVEMSPEGERHPHVWAQKALDGDPGARLAFRLDVPKKHMMDSAFYPKSTTFEDARKANSFMDWMSGVPDKVLLERPRRYVLFSGHCEDDLPAGVSGPGAYFTDDDCKLHRYGSMKRYAQVGAGEPDAKRRMLTR
ncbi:hypothetical protein BDV28DRAFT_129932 [Aspergillus coremiiformis]|uniref:Uncharacterized protein n=1 Tax=Aspergillus coremiiformis TaxID=138285 RepID=A0A5N6ZFV8_9EURO|nr:hypothetical protein BDV28DRAFT_129932 [Aspergillus coremiiformis]